MLEKILSLLGVTTESMTTLSLLAAGVWAIFKFSEYLKDKRFNTYHRLIKELVEVVAPATDTKIDKQIAVIFELRNYPDYYPVTKRILEGLRENWKTITEKRLLTEIDLTISFIDNSNE